MSVQLLDLRQYTSIASHQTDLQFVPSVVVVVIVLDTTVKNYLV